MKKKEYQPIIDKDNPPLDRSKESHSDAVNRYLSQIPKDETPEQRARRINRFRCGY